MEKSGKKASCQMKTVTVRVPVHLCDAVKNAGLSYSMCAMIGLLRALDLHLGEMHTHHYQPWDGPTKAVCVVVPVWLWDHFESPMRSKFVVDGFRYATRLRSPFCNLLPNLH
jgi:hypothetical protein